MALVAVVGAGCSGLSGISKNIKDDQAIVVVKVMTPWGPQHMTRIGGTTNSVTVGPDGKVTINHKPVQP